MATVTTTAAAWLLKVAPDSEAALGSQMIREVLGHADLPEYPVYSVPKTPIWCRQLLFWRNQLLPILDISLLLYGAGQLQPEKETLIVVAYEPPGGKQLAYGAIRLWELPRMVHISNEQLCPYPEPHRKWRSISLSCFDNGGEATPVLDTNKLFLPH